MPLLAQRAEPKPLILVVEDEEELSKLISLHLDEAGMQTQIYNRCGPAIKYLTKSFANLLLLDVNLPDQTGFAMMEELKSNNILVPTIFLTGNASEVNKVRGLELGGDDYITKPFGFPELVARIRAVLRRTEASADLQITRKVKVGDQPFEFCGATVSPLRLQIEFGEGRAEKIGRKELGILSFVNDYRGTIVTRKSLIHSVWGIHADIKSRSLDQYVVKIREIYQRQGLTTDSFRTLHGIGYIYDPENKSKHMAALAR